MDRSLTLELVRVTEAAAIAAARWMGRGQKNEADDAATTAMRAMFDTIPMDGTVVIGEGELDEAPMLYIGEPLGIRGPGHPEVDVAVDPLEGTNIVAKGLWNAITVVAIADRGNLLHAPDMYMDKIAVGPEAKGYVHIDRPIEENIRAVAKAKGKDVEDVVVVVLDRPRHEEVIARIRNIGARIKLIPDGDVAGAISTAFAQTGIDMLVGIGGAPEGVITAVALKCMGGDMMGRLKPQNETELRRLREMGIDNPDRVLYLDDLVRGDDAIFAATGVTDGELLRGVRFMGETASTHSVVMRAKTGTVRFVDAEHRPSQKPSLVIKDFVSHGTETGV